MEKKIKMKKIALITYHRAINYGSILQTYATYKKIYELGHKCTIIDYESYSQYYYYSNKIFPNIFKIKFRKISILLFLYKLFKNSNKRKNDKIKKNKFDLFAKKNFCMTKHYSSKNELRKVFSENCFDIFMTGSDQTWNSNCLEHLYQKSDSTGVYYFDFVDNKAKRVAFCSSLGNMTYTQLEKKKNLINKYSYISTREEQGKKLISRVYKKNIDVCVDPTFLLKKEDWNMLIQRESLVAGDYIVLYSLQKNNKIKEWLDSVKIFAKKRKWKIVVICPFCDEFTDDFIDANNSGPREFLNIFNFAKFVLVDSFHGLCFSIIYRKDFLVLGNKYYKKDIRKKNLLSKLSLENRMIENESEINNINDLSVHYASSENIIENEINNAIECLKNAINIT